MALPRYQELLRPILEIHVDQSEHTVPDIAAALTQTLRLSDEDQADRIKSGRPRLISRIEWARYFLLRAGTLVSTGRGRAKITDRGRNLLQQGSVIDRNTLMQFPEFVAWLGGGEPAPAGVIPSAQVEPEIRVAELTPEERIEAAQNELRISVEQDLLDRVRAMPPAFFENLVVDLLLRLGYGSDDEAGERLGKSGDGGVDGVIREDWLGLDLIYVQAKRWQARVGRPDVQAFVGSLEGQRARKGVMITTSDFTDDARSYVRSIEKSVVLMDGATLAHLMFETGLGVTSTRTLDVKQVYADYFDLSEYPPAPTQISPLVP